MVTGSYVHLTNILLHFSSSEAKKPIRVLGERKRSKSSRKVTQKGGKKGYSEDEMETEKQCDEENI